MRITHRNFPPINNKPCISVMTKTQGFVDGYGILVAKLVAKVMILHLDFYVHAAGKFELHQRVHSLGGAAVDINEALVSAELELLAALLVYEGGTVHREDALTRGKRNRTAYNGTGGLHILHDFFCALLYECVVVAFEFDSNFLTHNVFND